MTSEPATNQPHLGSPVSAHQQPPNVVQQSAEPQLPKRPISYPVPIFFYGTLMLPHILKKVLRLDPNTIPALYRAQVLGHNIKLWGPYPALVQTDAGGDSSPGPVGMVYMLEEEQHLRRLEFYEGINYKLGICSVVKDGETTSMPCYAFVWDGHPKDLREGAFDPTRFAK